MKLLLEEFEFTETLKKLVGIDDDEVSDLIERLDVDELTDLIDACMNNNKEAALQAIGNKTEGDEQQSDDSEHEHELDDSEYDEDVDPIKAFHIGDKVMVDEEEGEATIKIPSAPGDTVGVTINGELKMVDKSAVHGLKEAVLGMTSLPGMKPNNELSRIRELAGLPAETPALPPEDDMGMDDHSDYGMDDHSEYGMDDVGMDSDMGDDYSEPAPSADYSMSDASMAPPLPVTTPDTALEDAAALDHAISEIEAMIPNVKLSEYKTLVARLKALVSMAENAGKSALTESRKIKEGEFSVDDRDAHLADKESFSDWLMHVRSLVHTGISKAVLRDYYDQGKTPAQVASLTEMSNEKRSAYIDAGRKDSRNKINTDREKSIKRAHHVQKAEIKNQSKAWGEGEKIGEDKFEPKKKPERKTLMDYVNDGKDMQSIGNDRNSAVKAMQDRMGKATSPQDANKAFDALSASGHIKQNNGVYQMKAMDDNDFNNTLAQTYSMSNTATNGMSQQSPTPTQNQGTVAPQGTMPPQ